MYSLGQSIHKSCGDFVGFYSTLLVLDGTDKEDNPRWITTRENRVKNPIMRVIKPDSYYSQMEFLLGFIFMGKSVVIPQLTTYFDHQSITYKYLAADINIPSVDDLQTEMNDKLIQFLKNKNRKYKLVSMPFTTDKLFIHIGFYQKNWYVATSMKGKPPLDVLAHELLPSLYKLKGQSKNQKTLSKLQFIEKVNFKFEDSLEMDFKSFYFLYLKTAFNALAYFNGALFVLNSVFDEIRKSIIEVGDSGKFARLKEKHEQPEIESYIEKFPNKAHYVIIFSKDNILSAYVSFYGETPAVIALASDYEGEFFIDGLICDWENAEETRLEKWI
ncbi:hypothetical protein ACSFXN_07420 [Planococcus sp. 1R117A]|uniref:hypothetical protein n=1 Tax=Planococcus sp. 1R117A TaxID=3447020 RepID=UPI003EDC84A6